MPARSLLSVIHETGGRDCSVVVVIFGLNLNVFLHGTQRVALNWST